MEKKGIIKLMNINNRGYALIIVLWAIVILGIIFTNLVEEVHLNNFIVKNNLDYKEEYQAAISGIMIGISKLKEDESDYDTKEDDWLEIVKGDLDGISYQVEIKDIGNKLNINYVNFDLLKNLDWWTEEIEKEVKEGPLIADIVLLEDILEEEYGYILQYLNVYGKFNLNTGRIEALKKILELAEVDKEKRDLISSHIKNKREKKEIINEVDDLKELSKNNANILNIVDDLKDYLTTEGNLNINLVSETMLNLVLRGATEASESEIPIEEYKNKILEYRNQEEIKKIDEFDELLPKELSHIFKSYFTVSSRYFLIRSTITTENNKVEIESVVNRRKDDNDKWRVKILKWKEV